MIKNYTSSVDVSRTISRIEMLLAEYGATDINKSYSNGVISSLAFSVKVDGRFVPIRLPVDSEAVYRVMASEVRRARKGTFQKLKDQAARTAWKLMQDWVEVQLSLIRMKQAEFIQVFLPYVWNGEKTFFAVIKENGFKALPAPERQTT